MRWSSAATTPMITQIHGKDFLVDPDVCNGRDGRRVTGCIQAVHLFQRGQYVVMGYRFAVCAGFHVRTVEDGWDLVVFAVVVLVPGDHQQAVVGLCPGGVGGQVVVQPGITLGDGPVVHVVVEIWDDKRDGWQARVVRAWREGRERHRVGGRHIGEVHPRGTFACIFA